VIAKSDDHHNKEAKNPFPSRETARYPRNGAFLDQNSQMFTLEIGLNMESVSGVLLNKLIRL